MQVKQRASFGFNEHVHLVVGARVTHTFCSCIHTYISMYIKIYRSRVNPLAFLSIHAEVLHTLLNSCHLYGEILTEVSRIGFSCALNIFLCSRCFPFVKTQIISLTISVLIIPDIYGQLFYSTCFIARVIFIAENNYPLEINLLLW